ncbi:hypothetical protein KSP35_22625 [Aquihabitans sp. G128]|uniref:hypothetical protein n=1 Tax=Aquihabitans sp. G128 TaxID=2849779 RepID=UPI001C2468AA|nr:hypothetical protein [Aquihabitans sp. G128]QXC61072.1 hypothetical protein KSP35_22625 [Aquihabitans sp. G128]
MTRAEIDERFRWVGLGIWALFTLYIGVVTWIGRHPLGDVVHSTTPFWLVAFGIQLVVRGVLRSRAAGWR